MAAWKTYGGQPQKGNVPVVYDPKTCGAQVQPGNVPVDFTQP